MSDHSINSRNIDWQGMDEDNYFDGRKKIIPDGTVLECEITDGYTGPEIGKVTMVCSVWLRVVSDCEFKGQTYKFSPKIYDNDATKRDRGNMHLDVIDAAAGDPLTNGGLELTTENMQAYWAGTVLRVKFGFIKPENEGDTGNNFIAGVALTLADLAKRKAESMKQSKPQRQPKQPAQQPMQQPEYEEEESQIDF